MSIFSVGQKNRDWHLLYPDTCPICHHLIIITSQIIGNLTFRVCRDSL